MNTRKGPPCPACGRATAMTHQERGKLISKGIEKAKASGNSVGRPRNCDYLEVYRLRDSGRSLSFIASILKVSRGAVEHALRTRE